MLFDLILEKISFSLVALTYLDVGRLHMDDIRRNFDAIQTF